MALLLHSGAIFLHVPKTGGSFITSVLNDLGLVRRTLGHIHADRSRVPSRAGQYSPVELLAENVKSRLPVVVKQRGKSIHRSIGQSQTAQGPARRPFTFCFVRDPLCWYESFWSYMTRRAGPDWSREPDLLGWHPCAPLAHLGHGDFAGFMEAVVRDEPGFVTQLYGRYVMDGIDFVGRQESLTDDLVSLLERLDVPHNGDAIRSRDAVNTSRTDRIEWPSDLRAEVERLEYSARVRFGYESARG